MIKEGMRRLDVVYCYYNGNNLEDVAIICGMAKGRDAHYFLTQKDDKPIIRDIGPFHDCFIELPTNHYVITDGEEIIVVSPDSFKSCYIEGKPIQDIGKYMAGRGMKANTGDNKDEH